MHIHVLVQLHISVVQFIIELTLGTHL